MNSLRHCSLLALVALALGAIPAGSQAPALAQLPVGVRRLTPPTIETARLFAAHTDRERRGTYAGIGMLVGFIAGVAYGHAHTSPPPDLLTVMAYGCGGMVLGAVSGVVVYQVVEGGRH